MKVSGLILLLCGLLWVGIAFRMDTTVTAGGEMVGDTWIPTRTVHNIGLQDERRNHLLIASLVTVVGVLLFGFGSLQTSRGRADLPPVPAEPPCARDLSLDPYKVWLVARYGLQRNEVLGSWACGDSLFPDVDAALDAAHLREMEAQATREQAAQRAEEARAEAARQAAAASALRAQTLQRWRVVLITLAVLVLGGGGYAAYHAYQAEQGRLAEVSALQARVAELESARDTATAARERALAEREAALSSAAAALESAELAKLEVRLVPDELGLGYTATVKNRSAYYLESLTGQLHPLSAGADFGAETFFLCCDRATDQHGFDRGYAIAPGGTARKEQALGIYDVQADSPERRKFASDHGVALTQDGLGQPSMPIEATARVEGSARWVREPRHEVSGETNSWSAEPVDFRAIAEHAGDWRAMDAAIAGLGTELADIAKRLEEAQARLQTLQH